MNGVDVIAAERDVFESSLPHSDVLLVGDLFYERELAERILELLEIASQQGTDVLVGDPRRSYFPVKRFTQVALYEVPVTRELEDMEIKRTAVWRFSVPPASLSFLTAGTVEAA